MNPFYEQRDQAFFVGKICDTPFPLHVHKVVECVHLLRGHLRMRVGASSYDLLPGDTVMVFPSVSHSYEEVSADADGICMIFLSDAIAEFSDLFRTSHPVVPVLRAGARDAGLCDAAERLHAVSQSGESALLKAYLHVFLAHLFLCMPVEPLESHIDTSLTQQVLQYISQHYQEDITLDSVARTLGISRSHLSHIFSAQLRVNFRRYINTLRIDHACALLRDTSMTITEIGYACGYNNPRTFHRAFLDEHHQHPGAFRESFRGNTVRAE